jgi:hypothetical protein
VTPERAESTQTQTVELPAGAGLRVVNAIGSTRVAVDPTATSAEVEIIRIALAETEEEADALLDQMQTSVTLPTEGNNILTVTTQKPESATLDEAQFSATVTDDEIHIVSIAGSSAVVQFRVRITLPPGHGVEVAQTVGPVRAISLDAPSDLSTESGSIHLMHARSSVTARAEAGQVDVDGHEGALAVDVGAGSAGIEVLSLPAGGQITGHVDSGSLEIALPRDVNADLTATTQAGLISFRESDFDATSNVLNTSTYVHAGLGIGGAIVDLSTEVGAIDIDSF